MTFGKIKPLRGLSAVRLDCVPTTYPVAILSHTVHCLLICSPTVIGIWLCACNQNNGRKVDEGSADGLWGSSRIHIIM
jgi:hypothetical protein